MGDVVTDFRREHDLLGTRDIPANAYWGIHTLRARENFPAVTGIVGDYPHFVSALAAVKQASACANHECGVLDRTACDAIVAACVEIRDGALHDQFVVPIIQGGAGTSTNMNANEVIANRALEILGHQRGDYSVINPNEHVNLSQSTNDVYPTALRMAVSIGAAELRRAIDLLCTAFDAKAREFAAVLKVARTQLQDAVPMPLGREFAAFSTLIRADRDLLAGAEQALFEINLGGTAIGTGLNTPPGYASAVCAHLARIAGLPLHTAPDLIAATQDCGAFVQASGALRQTAGLLSKICDDLRLLSSGPRAGLMEIELPAVQAGSSIMPGKVNPVIPEFVNQIAFQIAGADLTVAMAAQGGQLQLNAFEPVIGHCLLTGFERLRVGIVELATCVSGITCNRSGLAAAVTNSIGVVAALNPYLGYSTATEVARDAMASGRGVAELVRERNLLSQVDIERALNPATVADPV